MNTFPTGGYGFGPPQLTAMDLFFSIIVFWVAFLLLWLIFCLPFKVMLQTATMWAAVIAFALSQYDPVLMGAAIGAGLFGYFHTRRRPLARSHFSSNPFGEPPDDDLEFYLYANRFERAVMCNAFDEYLNDPRTMPHDRLNLIYLIFSIGMYCGSVGWTLITASCFFFVYAIALTTPTIVGILLCLMSGLTTGMQIGMLMKRRKAEKILRKQGYL